MIFLSPQGEMVVARWKEVRMKRGGETKDLQPLHLVSKKGDPRQK
jgi:hypothetical protein